MRFGAQGVGRVCPQRAANSLHRVILAGCGALDIYSRKSVIFAQILKMRVRVDLRYESGRGLGHSKTWWSSLRPRTARSVLKCPPSAIAKVRTGTACQRALD